MISDISEKVLCEVYGILIELGDEYIEKIPFQLFNYIKNNINVNYISKINFHEDLENQISNEALNFIALLNLKYWCNEAEKDELIEQYTFNDELYNQELNKKYSYDNLFKDTKKESVDDTKDLTDLVCYKESFFKKIFNKIFSFLSKK